MKKSDQQLTNLHEKIDGKRDMQRSYHVEIYSLCLLYWEIGTTINQSYVSEAGGKLGRFIFHNAAAPNRSFEVNSADELYERESSFGRRAGRQLDYLSAENKIQLKKQKGIGCIVTFDNEYKVGRRVVFIGVLQRQRAEPARRAELACGEQSRK
ncbi:hypothetical protein EVAR_81174_1 [Eumeta japonica]|uniref:Uncharacterized protein n=1 Tax=Eumeta variegata TaxID=151549 RepID=A0A4C1UKG8_EUMVA|nr:hypothetical protein EVAR_81174_1 [Eumeta japonica]